MRGGVLGGGIACFFIGLILVAVTAQDVSACNSGLGQVYQFLGGTGCNVPYLLAGIGYLLLLIGVILIILGAVLRPVDYQPRIVYAPPPPAYPYSQPPSPQPGPTPMSGRDSQVWQALGYRMGPASTQPIPPPPVPPPPTQAAERYCPSCGGGNARSSAFCESCGKPLPARP